MGRHCLAACLAARRLSFWSSFLRIVRIILGVGTTPCRSSFRSMFSALGGVGGGGSREWPVEASIHRELNFSLLRNEHLKEWMTGR